MGARAGEVLLISLGSVFALAGVLKLWRPQALLDHLLDIGVAIRTARAVAYAVPVVELIVGAWLISSHLAQAAAGAGVILSLGFTVAGVVAIRVGATGCRCFAMLDQSTSAGFSLGRALVLATIAALGANLVWTSSSARSIWAVDPVMGGVAVGAGLLSVGVAALVERVLTFEQARHAAMTQRAEYLRDGSQGIRRS